MLILISSFSNKVFVSPSLPHCCHVMSPTFKDNKDTHFETVFPRKVDRKKTLLLVHLSVTVGRVWPPPFMVSALKQADVNFPQQLVLSWLLRSQLRDTAPRDMFCRTGVHSVCSCKSKAFDSFIHLGLIWKEWFSKEHNMKHSTYSVL